LIISFSFFLQLKKERERTLALNGDMRIASAYDLTIHAITQVIENIRAIKRKNEQR